MYDAILIMLVAMTKWSFIAFWVDVVISSCGPFETLICLQPVSYVLDMFGANTYERGVADWDPPILKYFTPILYWFGFMFISLIVWLPMLIYGKWV